MNEKKQSGKKRLFLLVLVAFGIVLWITFTNLNRIALRHTLDETIGFVLGHDGHPDHRPADH